MPVDETKFTHVRIRREAAQLLKKLAAFNRRSVNEEANIAVENYTFRRLPKKEFNKPKRKNKNGK